LPGIDTSTYRIGDYAKLRDLVREKLRTVAGQNF